MGDESHDITQPDIDFASPGKQGFGNHVRDMHDPNNTASIPDAEFDSVKQIEHSETLDALDADGVAALINFSSFNPALEEIINKDQTIDQGPSPN